MSQIPRFSSDEIIPRSARGYSPDEFLYFDWVPEIPASRFKVLVEDLSGRWVNLGAVNKRVYVPNTYFPAHATLVIVGANSYGQQVRFISELQRGQKYKLKTADAGDHYVERSILASAV